MATTKRLCCVAGCPATNPEPTCALLPFPPRDTDRYKRWITLHPNSFVLRENGESYICKRHFSADCFGVCGQLKQNAVPTLNVTKKHVHDHFLETFLIKVVYEWSLRTATTNRTEIGLAAVEAANILGISGFRATEEWLKKFKHVRQANINNGLRFMGRKPGVKEIPDIIEDLRKYLPINIKLQTDVSGNELTVKNECLSDDESVEVLPETNELVDIEKPKIEIFEAETETIGTKEDPKPLMTYQDALKLLKPLETYVLRVGNDKAMARIGEITTIVQEAIDSERKPRKGVKRPRTECV